MRVVRTGALCAVSLVGSLLLLRAFVEHAVFLPEPGVPLRPAQLGLEAEDVFLTTEDDVRIHAWWLPAAGASRAVLFLHGNAGNASHRLPNAGELVRLETHVLLLDYRGYGRSEGTPTEQGVYLDARAAVAHLERERGVPPRRIVVFGRSLGSAVAVDVAQGRELGGLILESAFSSGADMAVHALKLPVGWAFRDIFDSAAKVSRVRAPCLFFHGDRDRTVPIRLGQRLFTAAPEPKAFEVIAGAGHNDTTRVGGRRYFERIRRFLDEVAPP